MGRTTPTYRDFLRGYEEDWAPFRRALRRDQQAAFDRLFERAHDYADAAGHQNAPDPRFAVLLSMLVAQEHELQTLRDRLEE